MYFQNRIGGFTHVPKLDPDFFPQEDYFLERFATPELPEDHPVLDLHYRGFFYNVPIYLRFEKIAGDWKPKYEAKESRFGFGNVPFLIGGDFRLGRYQMIAGAKNLWGLAWHEPTSQQHETLFCQPGPYNVPVVLTPAPQASHAVAIQKRQLNKTAAAIQQYLKTRFATNSTAKQINPPETPTELTSAGAPQLLQTERRFHPEFGLMGVKPSVPCTTRLQLRETAATGFESRGQSIAGMPVFPRLFTAWDGRYQAILQVNPEKQGEIRKAFFRFPGLEDKWYPGGVFGSKSMLVRLPSQYHETIMALRGTTLSEITDISLRLNMEQEALK